MGTEKEPQEKIKRFKILVAISVVAVLFFAPVICEVAYNFGYISKSPANELLKVFGASATDDESEFVEFLSVGQADSAIIKSQNKCAIIDFGLKDESDLIYKRLKKLGIKKVDLAIATHNDSDHLGGYLDLAENIKIDKLVINKFSKCDENKDMYYKTIITADANNTELVLPNVLDSFEIGNAVLEILYVNPSAESSNNKSIVTMLTLNDKKVLFTGDLEVDEELKLQRLVPNLDCDILKLGHHGSKTSTSDEFLSRTTPRIAIASCGYDNNYKHPSKEVRQRLEKVGVKIYRTDLDQNIRCEIGKEKITVFKIS